MNKLPTSAVNFKIETLTHPESDQRQHVPVSDPFSTPSDKQTVKDENQMEAISVMHHGARR